MRDFSYYWLEVVSWAGLLCINGAAPPPSRKLWETPELPPLLVELSMPLKYWRRFTSVPLYFCPTARIPGTAKETVSRSCFHPVVVSRQSLTILVWLGVVANNGGVDEHRQQRVLVGAGVVLEESGRV